MTKIVASTMPGKAKTIWMSWSSSHGPEQALGAEHQHVDQAGDHRRHRERQVDQRHQQALAAEIELGHAQAALTPNTRLSGTEISHREHGELQRRQGVRLEDRGEEGAEALASAPGTPR